MIHFSPDAILKIPNQAVADQKKEQDQKKSEIASENFFNHYGYRTDQKQSRNVHRQLRRPLTVLMPHIPADP